MVLLLLACADGPSKDGPLDTADPGDSASGDTADSNDTADSTDTEDSSLPGDADGDGHVDAALGGDDCDDGDAWTYPGAEEWCDPVDHDCDGEALEAGVCAKAQVVEALAGATVRADPADYPYLSMLWSDLDDDGDDEWVVSVSTEGGVHAMIDAPISQGEVAALDGASHTFQWDGSGSCYTMLGVPDFDGDGVGDLVMVGYGYLWPDTGAHVLLGPASDWPSNIAYPGDADAHWMRWDEEDGFGYDADAGGDVNGDGLADIVLTTRSSDAQAVLIPGRADPVSGSAGNETLLTSDFGNGVAFVGDQDGDGLSDLIFDEYGVTWVSGAGVEIGGVGDWGAVELDALSDTDCLFQYAVKTEIGDWTGDGLDDVAWDCVAANPGSDGVTQRAVHLLDGAALAVAPAGSWPGDLSAGSWSVDYSLADAVSRPNVSGDLDGDGIEDLLFEHRFGEMGEDHLAIIPVLSTDGVPGPGTDPAARGYSLRSGFEDAEPSAVGSLATGDVDGDGRIDLAFLAGSYMDRSNVEARVLFGWDLPWHEPEWW